MRTRSEVAVIDRPVPQVLTGLVLVAGVGLAGQLLGDRIPPLDRWMLRTLSARTGDGAAAVISGAGSLVVLAALLVAFVGAVRHARRGGPGIVARGLLLFAVCALPIGLQAVFRRPGPEMVAADWTFPSGHVVLVTAAAFTALVLTRPLARHWRLPVLATVCCVIPLVAASRVALGEHYLVDVAAAVPVTIGIGLLAALALRLPVYRQS